MRFFGRLLTLLDSADNFWIFGGEMILQVVY